MRIGIAAAGYADGYPRNRAHGHAGTRRDMPVPRAGPRRHGHSPSTCPPFRARASARRSRCGATTVCRPSAWRAKPARWPRNCSLVSIRASRCNYAQTGHDPVLLRGKIFLLVVAVLLSLTTTMMLVTQRDVTATVAAGEQHAIGNVMDLLRRDLDSRWATLLQEKVEIVSGGKRDLRRMGQTLQAMVETCRPGPPGRRRRRRRPRPGAAWINRMSLDTPHDVYVYDAGLHVLASNRHDLIDADLSGLKDIKGHVSPPPCWPATARRAWTTPCSAGRMAATGAAKPAMPTSRSFPLAMDAGGRRRHARRAAAPAGTANRWSRP